VPDLKAIIGKVAFGQRLTRYAAGARERRPHPADRSANQARHPSPQRGGGTMRSMVGGVLSTNPVSTIKARPHA